MIKELAAAAWSREQEPVRHSPLSFLLAPARPIDVYQPMFIILNAVQDVPPGWGE